MTSMRSSAGRLFAGIVAALALSSVAAAQTGTIRGTVTDSVGRAPISGVQVTVVGTRLGAVTGATGQYVIRGVTAGPATVSAQRLGFGAAQRATTVRANDTVTVDIGMGAIATVLSEVVSVGYGTSSRHDVSSAIASIDNSAFVNTPVASIDNALAGKVAGVQVLQNSGEPGSALSIRVRGPASLNAGNQPLYVVDGVPIIQESYDQNSPSGQDMTAVTGLNPNEIEKIDVLKDAAATAIYGSRGSNGVVLITTKRGVLGNSRFNLSAYTGMQHVAKQVDMLTGPQYVMLMNEGAKNDNVTLPYTPGVDDTINTNWQDAVFRGAPVSDAQLAVSGGVERIRYFASGGAFDQKGIVIGSRYRRQTGRVNLDLNATNKMTLRMSVGLTREDDDRVQGDGSLDGVVTNALALQPMRPVYGSTFGFGGTKEGLTYSNPVALATFNSNNYKTLRGLGNVEGNYRFTDRLQLTARVAGDLFNVDERSWRSDKIDKSSAQGVGGVGALAHTAAHKYVAETFGNYDLWRTNANTVSLTAGTSIEYNHSDVSSITGQGFPTGFTTFLNNATNVVNWRGNAADNNLVSYFARANFSGSDKYLLSASLRTDGSSRFGTDNRYGIFPAISAGWVLSDESWASGIQRLGTLKLRASYGVTGNQGIGDYSRLSLATGTPYSGASGVAISQLGNPELKWETTKEADGGLDFSTFAGRLSIIADYYQRNTSNLLVQLPVPATSGFTSVWTNVGGIRNKGVDLSFHTINIDRPGFRWNSDLNVTFNRNTVTKLYGGQPITQTVNNRVISIVKVGQPVGEFYMYDFLRVDPQTGNAVYACVTASTSCVSGETFSPTSSDLTTVGNPQPKYYGGFTNTLNVGPFDLRGFLQFNQGSKAFNMVRIFSDDGGRASDNKIAALMNRWQKPGDITDVPRMSARGTSGARLISDRLLQDGSFVRLGDVTLGYTLPPSLAAKTRLHDARIYASGRNLVTWTKYDGYNPDVNSTGASANVIMGVDYYAYPIARAFTFGFTTSW
jgi:TonB-linked SusC/RagA family outer membrane protein